MEELQSIKLSPLVTIDILVKTFDLASSVGLILTNEEKNYILKLKPFEPAESILSKQRGAQRWVIETSNVVRSSFVFVIKIYKKTLI